MLKARESTAPGNDSFEDHYSRAAEFSSQRRFEDAVQAYRDSLSVRPLDLGARLNLGLVLQALERWDEAIACYEMAAAIAPEFAETQVRLGTILNQKGDITEALAAFQRAVTLDPFAARSHIQLAHALRSSGDLSGAEIGYRRAIELDPAQVEARAHLSTLLPQIGKSKEAEILLDYELLIKTRKLERIESWPTVEVFNDELARCIFLHPTLTQNPPASATEGGSQTLEIFDGNEPPIQALKHFVDQSVTDYLLTVGVEARHIFATPAPVLSLQGWAVVLRSGGCQLPHFHPAAFVSGVYYVRVPETVKTCRESGNEAGFLKFGSPADFAPAVNGQMARMTYSLRPQEGLIVLFPSYFWHYTVPFEGNEERISIAFDVLRSAANGTSPS
jgi:tetratricopeptide (TPR) repeat protein